MSRYQARHAAERASRPAAGKLAVVAGLTTALGVPVAAAAPASATPVRTGALGAATVSAAARPMATLPAAPLATAYVSMLRQGSTGTRVVALQRVLGVTADGIFGPRTRAAVVAFQVRHHLAADGIVGPITAGALGISLSTTSRSVTVSRSYSRSSFGALVVAEAARHVGKPYVYGAAGPSSFDCSGFVQYVFGRLGKSVPRTSSAQAAAATRVPQSSRQLGDLIIFYSGGQVSHVGIYAGSNTMWVARHTGTTITRQVIYTTSYSVGRF